MQSDGDKKIKESEIITINADVLSNKLRDFESSIHRPRHIVFDIMLLVALFATVVTIGSIKDPDLFGIHGGVWQGFFVLSVFFSLGKLIYDGIRFFHGKRITRQNVLDDLLHQMRQK